MKAKTLFLMMLAQLCCMTAMAVEAEIDGLWYELVSKAKEAKVINYKGTAYSGNIVIPATVEYDGVTYNVTSIGERAFLACTSLTSITIPSSVTSIGNYAFDGCRSLTSITIPSSVTSIGDYAFTDCTGLTSITIPSSVTTIGGVAFYGCTSLTSITLPSSITSIRSGTFYGCTSLTSITIPSSVNFIGDRVFDSCTRLTSITIPSSVTTIMEYAFSNCTELTDVYCYAESVPRTESKAFEGSYIEYSTLHVPVSAIESYRTTAPWSRFGKIVTLDGEEPVVPEPEQCATPTIYYNSGKLSFKSDTEGATFVSEIKDADVKKFYDSEIALGVTYNISVYATRDGYKDSEVATATLCWIDVDPKKEGITNDEDPIVTGVKEQKSLPLLIQREGNKLSVSGAPAGTPIAIYDLSGRLLGASVTSDDSTKVHLQTIERTIIVKIGSKSVKVALQ